MCLWSLNKEVGSGVGSGFVRQRYGSGDPDPHQNVSRIPNTAANPRSVGG
jgi:hypothetical protein